MIEIINFFNKAPKTQNDDEKIDFRVLNKKSIKYGYIIHPDCCNIYVDKWLNSLTLNYNSTFYKEWRDVTNKTRLELFIDQILHYSTTYGNDHEIEDNGYVPNDKPESNTFEKYKLIEPISYSEIYTRCLDVLSSGIALNEITRNVMCDFIYDNSHHLISPSVIDNIKNKEAQAYLSCKFGIMPTDEFAILRCLVFNHIKSCLLIKSKSVLQEIETIAMERNNPYNIFLKLTDEDIRNLSKIFYRFKPLFLAFKNKINANIINRIRKLAKINHKPLKIGFWEDIISKKKNVFEIAKRIDELSNFKKIRLMQTINVALYSEEKSKVYIIRNGSSYVKHNYKPKYDKEYLKNVYSILEDSLIENLKTKSCKVYLPDNFNIALPSSEKSFVGNYPFGSSVKFDKNFVVGIYWQNDWGTYDYDLSFINFKGLRIGWNSGFYNDEGVVYSGDMTYANPNAVETMFIPNKCIDSTIVVNQYSGAPKSKFRFFVAQEDMNIDDIHNKMVNPDNIILDTMIDVNNEKQKTVGLIHNNTFYFMNLKSGNRMVSRSSIHNIEFINTMCERTKCFIDLKTILSKANFEFVDKENCDINFENVEKDVIIKLLT